MLRDLFGMIEIAGTSAGFNRLSAVNGQSADYAFNRLKSKYLGTISIGDEKEAGITTDGLYKKLVEVCNAREKKFPLDKTMLILLSCLAVLEYNGKQWFDIHPAVKALLHEMGKIPAEKEEGSLLNPEELGILIHALKNKESGFYLVEAGDRSILEDIIIKIKVALGQSGKGYLS